MKRTITAMEAHRGLTGLIVENTIIEENGGVRQFDAMWLSSLYNSSAKEKLLSLSYIREELKIWEELKERTRL